MTGQEQITQLAERLDRDVEFASALEADPLTTLGNAGFDYLVVAAEKERDRIAELVERIYRDDAFRRAIEEDPGGKLGDLGLPEVAIESLLLVAGAPDAVVERATADVEAHLSARKPATVAAVAAVLGTLAFAQEASAVSQPATTTQVSQPAATVQVSQPAATTQVSQPAATVQITPAAVRYVLPAVAAAQARAATVRWAGVGVQRAGLQGKVASLLSAHTTAH